MQRQEISCSFGEKNSSGSAEVGSAGGGGLYPFPRTVFLIWNPSLLSGGGEVTAEGNLNWQDSGVWVINLPPQHCSSDHSHHPLSVVAVIYF